MAAVGVAALGAGSASAQSAITTCGRTLDEPGSYHLDSDIGPCPGHGVVIAAQGVHLTLGGHTITGVSGPGACDLDNPQSGVVLTPGSSDVTVSGGTITGFVDGINVGGARSRVRGMTVAGNCVFGITVSGPSHRVDTSVVTGNATDGIALCESQDAVVTANHVSGSGRYAVIVSCGPTTVRNHITSNVLEKNGLPIGDGGGVGVFYGDETEIADNVINGNFVGIWLSWSANGTVRDNVINGNLTQGVGVSDIGPVNQVSANTAWGNGSFDLADDAAACGTTVWTGNFFGTDAVLGVPDGGPAAGCIQ